MYRFIFIFYFMCIINILYYFLYSFFSRLDFIKNVNIMEINLNL